MTEKPKTACTLVLLAYLCLSTTALRGQTQSKAGPPDAKPAYSTDSAPSQTNPDLAKKKLQLEIDKLTIENSNNERSLTTTRGWLNLVYGNVSVIVGIVLGFIGLLRYLKERKDELRKREEERFEQIVNGLGAELDQQRTSSALLLSTFLRKGYERFYLQVFNLAAGNLRQQPDTAASATCTDMERSPDAGGISPLRRALTSVLRESYPLCRDTFKNESPDEIDKQIGRYLNAAGVGLDEAYLAGADLRGAWLRESTFRYANLESADLGSAILEQSNFFSANLKSAQLSRANLKNVDFSRANLSGADISDSRAENSKFSLANLHKLVMKSGMIGGADFSGADLSEAEFTDVSFETIDGTLAKLETAGNLQKAKFSKVRGLTEEQIKSCKEKQAIFS